MRGLVAQYARRNDVAFVIVYQREPHAGRMAFAEVSQPTTLDERRLLAAQARDELRLPFLSLVDGMDDASRAWFSDLPAPVFVLDRYGAVAAKQPWIDIETLPPMIDRALAARPAAASARTALADALAAMLPAAAPDSSAVASPASPTAESNAHARSSASRSVAESRSEATKGREAGAASASDPLGALRRVSDDPSAPQEDRAAAALAACRRESAPADVAAAVALTGRAFRERPLRHAAALTHAADRLAAAGAASATVASLRVAAVAAVAAGTDPKIEAWLKTCAATAATPSAPTAPKRG